MKKTLFFLLAFLPAALTGFAQGSFRVSVKRITAGAGNGIELYVTPTVQINSNNINTMAVNVAIPNRAGVTATMTWGPDFTVTQASGNPAFPSASSPMQTDNTEDPGRTIFYRSSNSAAANSFTFNQGQSYLWATVVFRGSLASDSVYVYNKVEGGDNGFASLLLAMGNSQGIYAIPSQDGNTTNPFVTTAPQNVATSSSNSYTGNDYVLTMGQVIPLPVTLISFNATKTSAASAELKWITAEEKDMDYYEVERSADARTFSGIATRVRANNRKEQGSYTIDDRKVLNGDNYYRLRMVGSNGKSAYSEVRKLTFAAGKGYSLSPVPANDFVLIEGTGRGERVKLLSTGGQVIMEVTSNGDATRLPLDGIAAGNYFVQVIDGDKIVYNSKLIKQ